MVVFDPINFISYAKNKPLLCKNSIKTIVHKLIARCFVSNFPNDKSF
jgi:hypothetical protein